MTGAFGSKDDLQSLSNDLSGFDGTRKQLAQRIENLSAAKEAEIVRLRTDLKTAQAAIPAAPPKKIVVDDNEPPKKPAVKKKPVAKPEHAGTDYGQTGGADADTGSATAARQTAVGLTVVHDASMVGRENQNRDQNPHPVAKNATRVGHLPHRYPPESVSLSAASTFHIISRLDLGVRHEFAWQHCRDGVRAHHHLDGVAGCV